jgi:hypothetical protein
MWRLKARVLTSLGVARIENSTVANATSAVVRRGIPALKDRAKLMPLLRVENHWLAATPSKNHHQAMIDYLILLVLRDRIK